MTQNQPTISMIIPTYNAEAFVTRAVESALAQTCAPTEIIIVDHSSDNTLQIAQALAASHPCIHVYSIEASGVSAARNYGAAHATGELITYLDADDTLAPTMLEELVRLLQETGADIVGCDFREGDGSTTIYRGSEIITQAILAEHDTRIWSKLYRRSAIADVTFLESLTIGEDMLYFLTAALRTDLTYALLRRPLYHYTVNPKGAMERPFTPSYMDQIRCWDYAEGLLVAHDARVIGGTDNVAHDVGVLIGDGDIAHDVRVLVEAGDVTQTIGAPEGTAGVTRDGNRQQEPAGAAPQDILLTPDTYARLAAIQTVSAILVASKIARLDRSQRAQYESEWDAARASLRRYRENRKARDYYPQGYALKASLLEHAPALFCLLCGR